jgi:mRNA deadenylase 3'-5' endonuclease subunit Ccr4
MKVLDWNVCAFSKKQGLSIDQALKFNADLLCLQEVTKDSLKILKSTPGYSLAETKDNESKKGGSYPVILTKMRILNSGKFSYYDKTTTSPAAKIISSYTKESEKHDALYIDLEINGRIVRVYNLHISWPVSPSIRKLQFTNFLNIIKTHPYSKIICGDLNVFGGLKLYTLLAFFPFGYSKRDIFFNERKWFNTQFQELEMQNLWKILSHGLCFPLMRNLTMCWFQIPSLLPAQHSLNRGMVLTTLLI